jgi:type VI secretion system protein VasJ
MALLLELDAAAVSLPLVRWDPALVFEIKLQLFKALKAASNRKDADKPGIARRMAALQGEMTVLDPTRMLSLDQ